MTSPGLAHLVLPTSVSARTASPTRCSGASEQDDDLYVMINAWTEPLEFTVQEGEPGEWRRVIDTSLASPDDIAEDLDGEVVGRRTCRVDSRSVVVLVRPAAESREGNRGGLFLLEDSPQ